MSLAQSLANIIQQEARMRGQLGVQKAGIIPNAIQNGAEGLQGALMQMGRDETRKLQNEGMRTENKGRALQLSESEKEARDEAEIKAILLAIPDGPDAMQKRAQAFVKFWQARNPKKAIAMQESLQGEAINRAKLLEGRPGTELPKEAALPATPDSPIVPLEAQAQHPEVTIPGVLGPDTTIRPRTESDVMGKAMAMKQAEAGLRDSVDARKEERRQRFTAGQAEDRQAFEAEKQASQQDFTAQQNELNRKNRLQAAMLRVRNSGGGKGGASDEDIDLVAESIVRGEQPPDLSRMYGKSFAVRAALARKGYKLADAERDWKAINKHLQTLNGAQQERLRQAVSFTKETIPQLRDAYAEWKKQAGVSGFKLYNRAALNTMKNLPGKAGSAAANLDALISDFTSELGTVYKGGNASTDESLKLAAKNLHSEWNEQTFNDALKRIDESLQIRQNSIATSQAQGVRADSPYQPDTSSGPKVGERKKFPNGNTGVWDGQGWVKE